MNPEDDPRDPYILGQPMGWKAISLTVAGFALLVGSLLYVYFVK